MSNNKDELILVTKLKSMDPDLFRDLQSIEQFSEDVWNDRLLIWFTNHNVDHSREIIYILGQLLTPLEASNSSLTKHELFVLLASAYLHDIGMQFLKCDDIPIEKLTEKEHEEIRRRHAESSSETIIKRVAKSIDRDDFHLPDCIDEQYILPIARICKGHSSEYFAEVIYKFGESPCSPKGRTVRGELLTALLLIADELDLQCKRVNFKDTAKFNLSAYSMVHWYKHHYVDYINISNNSVKITLKYPPDSANYKPLIEELIKTKLNEQIKKVNPYLRKETNGVLSLDDQVNFIVFEDDISMKRPMPANVITELKRLLGKTVPLSLPVSAVQTPHIPRISEPTKLFTGMEQKRNECRDLLSNSNLISLEGLGGVGKTEFVLKCISEFLPKEKVILFDCLPDSKVDALIEVSGYPDVLKGENKTELSKYSGFIDLIEKDEKTLFLDNFQCVTGNSFEELLKFAERRLKKARVVLVTREHPDFGVKIVPIELHGLGHDALLYAKIFKNEYYKTLQVSDGDLENICSNLGGHPLAIELALQLLSYGESPENIISKIAKAEGKSRELSDRLLDEVFNHPKSTQEEKSFLLHFSVFRNSIDVAGISFLFDGRDLTSTLYKLINKKMVPVTNGMYRTHPLIREFCYQRLSDKETAHEKAASHLETKRTERFDRLLEEEIFYHIFSSKNLRRTADFISSTGDKFVLSGHTNSLGEMINRALAWGLDRPKYKIFLGDIATLRGEWDDASRHFEEAFSSNDADEKMTAEAYIKFGEILHRKGEVREALKYFEDANERCKKYGYKKEQGRSANDIGSAFLTLGQFEEAERWLSEGLDVSRIIVYNEGVADALIFRGSILHYQGDSKGALENYKASLKIRDEIGYKSGIADSLNKIGSVLDHQGDPKGALENYKASLKICEEIGYKSGIADSLSNIGSVLEDQGNPKGALENYKAGLKICKEIGYKLGIANSLNNIGLVLEHQGDLKGALEHLQESLKIHEGIRDKLVIADLLNNIGSVLDHQGDPRGALENYRESQKIREDVGYKLGIANSLNNMGTILIHQGYPKGALENYKCSLKICEEVGDKYGIAASLNNIGIVLQEKGDLPGALQKARESLKIRVEIGHKSGIADSLRAIGSILREKGDLPEALQKAKESLKICDEVGDKYGIANSLDAIGSILREKGDLPEALQKAKESLKIRQEIGNKSGIATSLNNLGVVLRSRGDLPGALHNYEVSLHIHEEIGNKSGIATSLKNIGEIWCAKKNHDTALVYLLKSFAIQNDIGEVNKQTADSVTEIRRELGLKKFREIFQIAYDSIPKELQEHIQTQDFTENKTVVYEIEKVGRNTLCPCGSGKKYKHCCLKI